MKYDLLFLASLIFSCFISGVSALLLYEHDI